MYFVRWPQRSDVPLQPLEVECSRLNRPTPIPPPALRGWVQVELQVTYIRVVSRAAALPFELVDATRSEEDVKKAAEAGTLLPTVSQALRLDHRYIDLRTPANQAIFRVQSGVCQVGRCWVGSGCVMFYDLMWRLPCMAGCAFVRGGTTGHPLTT